MIFNEKVLNDVYEEAVALDEENKRLYIQFRDKYLNEFKKFQNETMLTILKKI
jgi:hypothetical protein